MLPYPLTAGWFLIGLRCLPPKVRCRSGKGRICLIGLPFPPPKKKCEGPMKLFVITYGGNAPVQLEGMMGTDQVYFRARGNSCSVRVWPIGASDITEKTYALTMAYGEEIFAASFMPHSVMFRMVRLGLMKYLRERRPSYAVRQGEADTKIEIEFTERRR